MITLKRLFTADYERDGPAFYDPKQPKWSLFRSMLALAGLWSVLTATLPFLFNSGGVALSPGLVIWGGWGAILWWRDRVAFESWLHKKRETTISLTESQGIRP
jgi:hypothetical protein